jgi:hypothetical protein
METLSAFGWGLIGGLLAELLGLFKLRQTAPGSLPEWLRSWFYWTVTLSMIVAGGVLVLVYFKSGISLQPVIAVNVGASAPLIIGSLVAQVPRVDPGKVD